MKHDNSLDLKRYLEEIARIRKGLESNYNAQAFQTHLETERLAFLVRQYFAR